MRPRCDFPEILDCTHPLEPVSAYVTGYCQRPILPLGRSRDEERAFPFSQWQGNVACASAHGGLSVSSLLRFHYLITHPCVLLPVPRFAHSSSLRMRRVGPLLIACRQLRGLRARYRKLACLIVVYIETFVELLALKNAYNSSEYWTVRLANACVYSLYSFHSFECLTSRSRD